MKKLKRSSTGESRASCLRPFKRLPAASYSTWKMRMICKTCAHRLVIDLNYYAVTMPDNTAFGSMGNGAFASIGKLARQNRSRSRIIMTEKVKMEEGKMEKGKMEEEERLPPVHPGEVLLE